MQPIGLTRPRAKALAVLHRCLHCDVLRANRIAADTAAPGRSRPAARTPARLTRIRFVSTQSPSVIGS
jgi:hypothetical protein